MSEIGWLALILQSGVMAVLFKLWRVEREKRKAAEKLLSTRIGQLVTRRQE